LAIITKDEDFQALANRQGYIPPQVVWIRLGNCRKVVLLDAFSKILPALRDRLDAGDAVVEIR
jgi:predicted nuclease of predicted toxin-antitoxin system